MLDAAPPPAAHARALTPTEAAIAAAQARFEAADAALLTLQGAEALARIDLAAARDRAEASAARLVEAAAPEDGAPEDAPARARARAAAIEARRETVVLAEALADIRARIPEARQEADAAAAELAALVGLGPRRDAARELEAAARALRAAVAHLDAAARGPDRQRAAARAAGVGRGLGMLARDLPSGLAPRGRDRRRILEAAAALEAAADRAFKSCARVAGVPTEAEAEAARRAARSGAEAEARAILKDDPL